MKKKLGKKGFALVETLICAMFVVVVFTVLFENYMPIMSKYERYDNYDDISSKYVAFYIKKMISNDPNKTLNVFNKANNPYGYFAFDYDDDNGNKLCNLLYEDENFSNKKYCKYFVEESNINRIYLTKYDTRTLKDHVKQHNDTTISRPFELYVNYMPTFKNSAASKTGYYRVIVEIKHENSESDKVGDYYYTYANIEVN